MSAGHLIRIDPMADRWACARCGVEVDGYAVAGAVTRTKPGTSQRAAGAARPSSPSPTACAPSARRTPRQR